MTKKNETLEESTREVKASLNRLQRARIDFRKTIEKNIDIQIKEAMERNEFQNKFGEKMAIIDWTQL